MNLPRVRAAERQVKNMSEEKRYLRKEMPLYIGKYILKNHITPTVGEVAEHFQISKDTAYKHLIKLDEAGVVPYRHRIGIPCWMFKQKSEEAS